MREARNAIMSKFWPNSLADIEAVANQFTHELNSAFRQTSSYWEMVYGFAKHGIIDPNFFIETNGEGLFLLAKIYPFLEEFRSKYSPTAFRNAEWIATECEEGKRRFAMICARVDGMKAAMK